MSRKIRLGTLAALSLLLTACPTTMPRKQGQGTHTPNIPHTPQIPHQPAGNAVSHGTTLQPTGSSATYRAVSFHELPQWNEQSFGESLAAFQKSCLKLANQAKWQYTCARANQTAHSTAAAKAFFEQNFTPWQVSERGQAGGKVTGYYATPAPPASPSMASPAILFPSPCLPICATAKPPCAFLPQATIAARFKATAHTSPISPNSPSPPAPPRLKADLLATNSCPISPAPKSTQAHSTDVLLFWAMPTTP